MTGEGETLSLRRREYHVHFLDHGLAEQDPSNWERAMYEIMGELSADAAEHGWDIEAVALTSQRSSVIPVDSAIRPIAPAIMWQDKRTEPLCAALAEQNDLIFRLSGARVNSVYAGTKMTWFRENCPEIYKKTAKFLLVPDLLLYDLTGELATDHSYGGRTHLMNLRTRQWDDTLLEMFRVERDKLCALTAPGSTIGYLTPRVAALTGCPAGIPVISAGGDQQCGAVGQGVVLQGVLSITVGTGGFLLAAAEQVPESLRSDVICTPSAIGGQYVLEYNLLSCCAAFDWFRAEFYPENPGFEALEAELRRSAPGAGGCICLPYFQGRATPDFNENARGLFSGMTLGTRRCDLLRALLEGICYALGNGVDTICSYVPVSELRVNGGLSRSKVFNEILAGVCGTPLLRTELSDATACGALMVAATSLGVYRSVSEACDAMNRAEPWRIQPIPDDMPIYAERRGEANRLYALFASANL